MIEKLKDNTHYPSYMLQNKINELIDIINGKSARSGKDNRIMTNIPEKIWELEKQGMLHWYQKGEQLRTSYNGISITVSLYKSLQWSNDPESYNYLVIRYNGYEQIFNTKEHDYVNQIINSLVAKQNEKQRINDKKAEEYIDYVFSTVGDHRRKRPKNGNRT